MTNDNIPSHLLHRRRLRDFAKDKSPEVQSLVRVLRGQLCAYARSKSEAVKQAIAGTVARLQAALRQ